MAYSSGYGQTYFISVFAGEIRAEFGLSHAGWGAIYSAGTIASALVMVWVGGLVDHMRVRALGALVLIGLAVACLSMAAVSQRWLLVPVIMGLRFFGQGMASHIANTAMARWFVASRGKALSIATLGFAASEASLPVLFVALKPVLDWRQLWVLAALMALAAIPVLFALLRRERTPQSMGDAHQTPGMAGRHWTRADALRHPLFWYAVPAVMGPAAFMTAFYFHQVHVAAIKGWSHVELVALFPLGTLMAVVSMILSGLAIDRFGAGRLLPLFQLPMAAGFLLMGWTSTVFCAAIALMLMATTMGSFMTVPTAFWAEAYGTRHMGAIRAFAAALLVLGTAIGPILTGGLIDAGLPFNRQMPAIALFFVLSSALVAYGLQRVRARVAAEL